MFMLKNKKKRSGFTLIELMVTVLIASFVFLGVGVVLADAIKGYRNMFSRIHGDVINDAYAARLRFDKVCRQASAGYAEVDVSSVPSLKVYYYSVPNFSGDADLPPDMYAEFYLNGTDLMQKTATLAGAGPDPEILARNVTELQFSVSPDGKSAQMVMTLSKDREHSITVTCGSIMHN